MLLFSLSLFPSPSIPYPLFTIPFSLVFILLSPNPCSHLGVHLFHVHLLDVHLHPYRCLLRLLLLIPSDATEHDCPYDGDRNRLRSSCRCLVALSDLASEQSAPALQTMKKLSWFLNYAVTSPRAKLPLPLQQNGPRQKCSHIQRLLLPR